MRNGACLGHKYDRPLAETNTGRSKFNLAKRWSLCAHITVPSRSTDCDWDDDRRLTDRYMIKYDSLFCGHTRNTAAVRASQARTPKHGGLIGAIRRHRCACVIIHTRFVWCCIGEPAHQKKHQSISMLYFGKTWRFFNRSSSC